MPCQDRSNDTISYFPVYSLAILTAASLDSAPVVSNSTLLSDAGSVAVNVVARSTSGRLTIPL